MLKQSLAQFDCLQVIIEENKHRCHFELAFLVRSAVLLLLQLESGDGFDVGWGTHRKERLGLLFDHFRCCCCLVSRCQKHRSKGQRSVGGQRRHSNSMSILPQANGHEQNTRYLNGMLLYMRWWRFVCEHGWYDMKGDTKWKIWHFGKFTFHLFSESKMRKMITVTCLTGKYEATVRRC